MARLLGPHVRATTSAGTPALDVPAAVRSALGAAGVDEVEERASCTACATDDRGAPLWFSHRARREEQRQALVSWGR
ncbi:MAG: laccase domain-containing protein [Gemmatimonadetes bacterium]|nr:laccase domain-containing protein [Gemmatimonadota bacterium]